MSLKPLGKLVAIAAGTIFAIVVVAAWAISRGPDAPTVASSSDLQPSSRGAQAVAGSSGRASTFRDGALVFDSEGWHDLVEDGRKRETPGDDCSTGPAGDVTNNPSAGAGHAELAALPDGRPVACRFIADVKAVSTTADRNPCGEGWLWDSQDLNEATTQHDRYVFLCFQRTFERKAAISALAVASAIPALDPSAATCPSINPAARPDTDLNDGAGGNHLFLCVERGLPQQVTDVRFVTSPVPVADYGALHSLCSRGGQNDNWLFSSEDLNGGAGGKHLYLCFNVSSG